MFTLPDLSYGYGALEPYIDEETMRLHHDLHHGLYVKNLNLILSGKEKFLDMAIGDLIKSLDKIPEEIRSKVRNNAGQHVNHSMFWEIMTPKFMQTPAGGILEGIKGGFGSDENFREKFEHEAMGRFGSGWVFLAVDKKKLVIMSMPNGDSPLMEDKVPILALDVWEHAYYLKYKNKRLDYIKAWWNVVNWEEVGKRYNKAV